MPRSPGLATYPSPMGRNAGKFLIKIGEESYTVRLRFGARVASRRRQCFNSGASFASISSNDIEPLNCSPLMKKVGVASTFNCP